MENKTDRPKRPGFGRRINTWLAEPAGETFKNNKWKFWLPTLVGLGMLNAVLTALIFGQAGNLQNYMGGIVLAVGVFLGWLGVCALHYSDDVVDAQLARGVSALDSVTLIFVIVHFAFLMWAYGHWATLRNAEMDYKAQAEKFNDEARKVSEDNVKIAESARQIAAETTKAERLRNDSAYQIRKAAEAGARIPGRRSGQETIGPSLSTQPIELERPDKPKQSSTDFLAYWDWWIRIANLGELALAALTLIFIRVRTAKTNARGAARDEVFPAEIDVGVIQDDRTGRRFDQTRKSDSGRQSPKSGDLIDRKAALKTLREHLKEIAFYYPGVWFKADLIRGGVTIRLFKKDHGHEIMVHSTDQSDKLLAAVNSPGFRNRLIDELTHQGFPLGGGQSS